MAKTPASESPLDRLSLGAKQRFLASLKFGEKGLASFRYDDLQAELTATEIYRILGLFGMQSATSQIDGARIEDLADELIMAVPDGQGSQKDYQCIAPNSCYHSAEYLCDPRYC